MKKLICVVCKKVRSTRRSDAEHRCKPCRRKAGLDFGEPAAQPHPKRNKHKAKAPKAQGKKKKRGEE